MCIYSNMHRLYIYIVKCSKTPSGLTWHCLVGRHFSSFVTHEKNCYVYFYVGPMYYTIL